MRGDSGQSVSGDDTVLAALTTRVSGVLAVLNRHALALGVVGLVLGLAVFAAFQWITVPTTGFWNDELFTLWVANPAVPFGEAFATKILPDTNGPIYFSLAYWAQASGLSGRAAFLVLNFTLIGALLAVMVWRGFKLGLPATALVAVGLMLAGAPMLAYAPEGRVYGLAMAVTAVLAFIGGSHVARDERRIAVEDLVAVAVLAVLAAWMHIFAALFAGALGAALVIAGLTPSRRMELVRLGLVMGGAATLALIVWIGAAFSTFANTSENGFWITFDRATIINAFWQLKEFAVGPLPGVVLGAAFVAVSLVMKASRRLAVVIVVTGVIFIVAPMVVSLKMPIFIGRYLLVGAPAILVLVLILLRTQLLAASAQGASRLVVGTALAGVLFFVFPATQGVSAASWHFATRPDWRGMDVIEPVLADCRAGEIRTLTTSPQPNLFEHYTKGRVATVHAAGLPMRDVSEIDCPVYGWVEHYNSPTEFGYDWAIKADQRQVLAEFNLTNSAGVPLAIVRHPGGLVLLRESAAPAN